MKKRAILIILDSVGVGAMPDAAEFGDTGANTLGNIYRLRGSLRLPNLYKLGLSRIEGSGPPLGGCVPTGCYGRAAEVTKAKDTTSGHWELAGLIMEKPFRTFPYGFPKELMNAFERKIGRGTIGNRVASGTVIIQELGDEHVSTGKPIVYTSADSVFQIAAHEEVIPLDELYGMCETAREMLNGEYYVGRVIARPFLGSEGSYRRTENRRDFAIPPTGDTILDGLLKNNKDTIAIGKIEDIFANRGITMSDHTRNNHDGIESLLRFIKEGTGDFIFANLVDFDMLYGHRNDMEGYAKALEYFDGRLPEIIKALKSGDMLIIAADHGCDPTTPSTDHSREYIPVIVTGPCIREGASLGTLGCFADIGATVFEYITGLKWPVGTSFLNIVC